MSLRIAHVTATFPPYRGGTGNVCYYNTLELARRGHDVHVLTAAMGNTTSRNVRDEVTVHYLRELVRIGNAPVLPSLPGALRGFDIIHLHYPFILGAEMVSLAAVRSKVPFVVSFHNDLIGDGIRATIFTLYQLLSARLTIRRAERLCAVSLDHYESSHLRRSLKPHRPVAVELPNGVDTERFSPVDAGNDMRHAYGIPADATLLLFVAALDRAHHFKGLDRLLQAMQMLPPSIRLLVIGDGDLRPVYQQQAVALGIAERVLFVGAIDHHATPPFFRAADVTVLPSSPPESFGLVLIESLACGTPVIASNIPGVRTVVDDDSDGFLVEAGNIEALADAIRHMVRDETVRQEMGRRGRAKVEARYDWTQIGVRLETIYQHVLEDGRVKKFAHVRR
jgi:glycosyltransferase involved in cell wall biosynthesis